jgi:hypothetical protein
VFPNFGEFLSFKRAWLWLAGSQASCVQRQSINLRELQLAIQDHQKFSGLNMA